MFQGRNYQQRSHGNQYYNNNSTNNSNSNNNQSQSSNQRPSNQRYNQTNPSLSSSIPAPHHAAGQPSHSNNPNTRQPQQYRPSSHQPPSSSSYGNRIPSSNIHHQHHHPMPHQMTNQPPPLPQMIKRGPPLPSMHRPGSAPVTNPSTMSMNMASNKVYTISATTSNVGKMAGIPLPPSAEVDPKRSLQIGTNARIMQHFVLKDARYRGSGQVLALAWNSDGSLLATGSVRGRIKLYSFANQNSTSSSTAALTHLDEGKELFSFQSERSDSMQMNLFSWDPSNPYRLITVTDRSIKIWDILTLYNFEKRKKIFYDIAKPARDIPLVSFSPSVKAQEINGKIISISWNPTGKVVLFGTNQGEVAIMNSKEMTIKTRYQIPDCSQINDFAWLQSGSHFLIAATSTSDKGMLLVCKLNENVLKVAVSAAKPSSTENKDGLASLPPTISSSVSSSTTSNTNDMEIADEKEKAIDVLLSIYAHGISCQAVKIHTSGLFAITVGADSQITFWDLSNFNRIKTLDRGISVPRSISLSGDGRYMSVVSDIDQNFVEVIDLLSSNPSQSQKINQNDSDFSELWMCAWHPKLPYLAYSGNHSRAEYDFKLPRLHIPVLSSQVTKPNNAAPSTSS